MLYRNLLEFADAKKVAELSSDDIDLYAQEWRKQYKSSSSVLSSIFPSLDALEKAILSLKNNLPIQKKIFLDNGLNSFFKEYEFTHNLKDNLPKLLEGNSPWLKKMVTNHFLEGFKRAFRETGMNSFNLVHKLNRLYQFALPEDYCEVIDRKLPIIIAQEIEDISEVPSRQLSASHYVNILAKLPIDQTAEYKELLGKTLVNKVHQSLVANELADTADEVSLKNLSKAAKVAYKLTGYAEMEEIRKELSKKMDYNKSQNKKSSHLLRNIFLTAILFGVAYFVYYLINIYQKESNTYEVRYQEYLEEMNEFKANRKLSKEMIEQRKNLNISETYQYGEKNDVPLFYTFIQSNKYLSINEIEDEMYKLKSFINPDSLDVNKIFIKAHFYVTEKEKPYRAVTASYDNLKQLIKYKQETKSRATKRFVINGSPPQTPYRLNVELSEEYKSGILDLSVYDLYIYPTEDRVEIFVHNPMPSLVKSLQISDLKNMELPALTNDAINLAKTSIAMYHFLDGKNAIYRSPINVSQAKFTTTLDAFSAMFNWELTLSDDLAFYRIRSEDIGGYYLIEREKGRVIQTKVNLEIKDIQISYLITYEDVEI